MSYKQVSVDFIINLKKDGGKSESENMPKELENRILDVCARYYEEIGEVVDHFNT